jgi:hypothetical protein
MTEPGALGERARNDRNLDARRKPQVDEARARDLGGAHAFGKFRQGLQRLDQLGCELARIPAQALAELQRDVAREIAVRRIARALERELGRAGFRRNLRQRFAQQRDDLCFRVHSKRRGL